MSLYCSIAQKKVFITNFAKCTQLDARPLNNSIFKSYRDILLEEIYCLNPKAIITFGIQVSENLLNKKIFLKNYSMLEKESIEIKGQRFYVFPCPYPVGQGIRNMSLAVNRIKNIITDISYTKKI